MESKAIQEGDIIYFQSLNGNGFLGMEDFLEKDPSHYADSGLDNFVPKFFKEKNPHNFGMKCLFTFKFPGSEVAQGGNIRFGSMVDIIHYETQFALMATLNSTEAQNSYNVCFDNRQSFSQFQHWQIVPKFKIRSEGEMIFDNDCIVIKSANKKLGELSVEESNVIVSTKSLGFRIKVFRKLETMSLENQVFSNSVIQLYVPEREAFLGNYNPEIQNQHIKILDPSKLEVLNPAVIQHEHKKLNCSILFRIEYIEPLQCIEIKENQQIRLLNIQNAQYLTVENDQNLIFDKEPTQENLFVLEKIIKEKTLQSGDNIIQDALVKIKHVKTNQYLSLQSIRQSSSKFARQ